MTLTVRPLGTMRGLLALQTLVFGLWLLLPYQSFTLTPALHPLLLGPLSEVGWGVLWAGLGAVKVWCLYARKPMLRVCSTSAGAFMWAFMATILVIGSVASPGVALFVLLALFSLADALDAWRDWD